MLPLSPASAQDYVVHRDGPDRFPISVRGDSSPLYVAALGFPGVLRAARDLQTDLQRLAGTASALTTGAPDDEEITVPSGAEMGVAVEGSRASWPGADGEAKLQTFTRFGTSSTYVDVFNRGGAPFEFRIDNHAPWLRVTPSDGRIGKQ